MCTSFVINGERTYVGMNFDISDRPVKLVYQKESQLVVLQKERGQFIPALGMNKSGTFMNLHMVEGNEAGTYRRGKNCVHIMRLFEDVLGEKLAPSAVPAFVNDHTIVNVPQHSVHSLIASAEHPPFVVEPGQKEIAHARSDRDFLVMTNFSLSARKENEAIDADAPGADRYRTAYERLVTIQSKFELDTGFSILRDTAQHSGDYPTQLSLIAVPADGVVYFALRANFAKIYRFSFHDQQIRTETGFLKAMNASLSKKGVLLDELAAWQ